MVTKNDFSKRDASKPSEQNLFHSYFFGRVVGSEAIATCFPTHHGSHYSTEQCIGLCESSSFKPFLEVTCLLHVDCEEHRGRGGGGTS